MSYNRNNKNRKNNNPSSKGHGNPNIKGNNGHNGNTSANNDGPKKGGISRHKDGVQYLSYCDQQSKNFYYWLNDMSNQSNYDKLTYPWGKLFQHHDVTMIKLPMLENGEPTEPSKNDDGRYDDIEFIKYKAAFGENQIRSKEAKVVYGIIIEHLSFGSLSRI